MSSFNVFNGLSLKICHLSVNRCLVGDLYLDTEAQCRSGPMREKESCNGMIASLSLLNFGYWQYL